MKSERWSLYWKWVKRVAGILGAACIFCGISNLLDYMYVPYGGWEKILWEHFYEDCGKIDNLYLGSSHVYFDVNSQQLDEINGQYNFNLSASAQLLNGSYYLLKEAVRQNPVSHVYLELYYVCGAKHDSSELSDPIYVDYTYNWRNIDYMRNSSYKLEYMFSNSGIETYVSTIFPFSRYRTRLNDWDYIAENMSSKKENENLSVPYSFKHGDGNGYREYRDQGYLYSTRIMTSHDESLYHQECVLDKNPMGEKSEQYLRKIIDYCQKKNISLTLFISPIREIQLISTEGYDNYINQVQEIAEEYGIPFYDFNLVKEKYLPIQHNRYFADVGHLNYLGAGMFTDFFYEVVSGDIVENEQYFYASYAEKLQAQPFSVYGMYYRTIDAEGDFASEEEAACHRKTTYWVASNRDEGVEYKIVLTPDEGEEQMIQDYAENKEFILSGDEHGVCIISARMKEHPEEVQTLEVEY